MRSGLAAVLSSDYDDGDRISDSHSAAAPFRSASVECVDHVNYFQYLVNRFFSVGGFFLVFVVIADCRRDKHLYTNL